MVIEMPDGLVRIFISVPDPADTAPPTPADIRDDLVRLTGHAADLADPVWLARYRTSHRRASSFRAGEAGYVRVPIAGADPAELAALTARVGARYGRGVASHVVPAVRPAAGAALLDREHSLQDKYGVRRPTLVPTRPNWYIGYCGPVADEARQVAYLDRVLTHGAVD